LCFDSKELSGEPSSLILSTLASLDQHFRKYRRCWVDLIVNLREAEIHGDNQDSDEIPLASCFIAKPMHSALKKVVEIPDLVRYLTEYM
jgi:hypothetical protein